MEQINDCGCFLIEIFETLNLLNNAIYLIAFGKIVFPSISSPDDLCYQFSYPLRQSAREIFPENRKSARY